MPSQSQMDSHLPPAPMPAHLQQLAPVRPPVDIGYHYSEKDVYDGRQQYAPRSERGSKGSSKSRAHDSVISYPRSPNVATPSPPSPASSITSARKHRSVQSVAPSQDAIDAVPQPPRAHVDPEKAEGSPRRSSQPSASHADVTRQTIAYDVDDFDDEKGPEDKPVQLLVSRQSPHGVR